MALSEDKASTAKPHFVTCLEHVYGGQRRNIVDCLVGSGVLEPRVVKDNVQEAGSGASREPIPRPLLRLEDPSLGVGRERMRISYRRDLANMKIYQC